MSEWNKQGEKCACGSSTAHERIPGCTLPAGTAASTVSASHAKWSCGCTEDVSHCGSAECKRTKRVRATYDASTDPVPRLEPTPADVEAACGKEPLPVIPPRALRRCEHVPEGLVGLCDACRPVQAPAPSAVLEEAVGRLETLIDVTTECFRRCVDLPGEGDARGNVSEALKHLDTAVRLLRAARSEAKAREGCALAPAPRVG